MIPNIELSVLDLVPILSGETAAQSLSHALDLAKHGEKVGYKRYWFAEHHDAPGLGSSSPEVLIGHIASGTTTLRVGSGGIMLPNHSAFHMAEAFRTIEALYPGRIDMGLGRAPGSGTAATIALRRGVSMHAEDFPEQVEQLIGYLSDDSVLKAIPMGVALPEIWILGSSDFGAQFAAVNGLPFSFAGHFSSLDAGAVIRMYRSMFRPSPWLDKPKAMLAQHVICAETDEEAREIALSADASMAIFARTGKPMPLKSVAEAKALNLSADDRSMVQERFPKVVGSPETVRRLLEPKLEGVDELIVTSMIYDQTARKESYSLVRDSLNSLTEENALAAR